MDEDRLRWFEDVKDEHGSRVGGKAFHLAKLYQSGFPVPIGFCIEAGVYRDHVAALGVAGTDPAELERRIAEAPLPEALARALAFHCGRFGPNASVAVRSSASDEDGPQASYAGQQASFLCVRGEAAVAQAVARCWASLWSARAVEYRRRVSAGGGTPAMGVLVQEMVDAEVAGVAFTVDPVTGKDEIVIDASWGLGESVVSGAVTPDSFRVEKRTLLPVEAKRSRKDTMHVAGDGRAEARPVPPEKRAVACLAEDRLTEIGAAARAIEAFFGAPQDVEWAVDATGRLHILQARPVTTRPRRDDVAASAPPGEDDALAGWLDLSRMPRFLRRRLSRAMIDQWLADKFPVPLKPFDVDVGLPMPLGGGARLLRDLGLRLPEPWLREDASATVRFWVPVPSLAAVVRAAPALVWKGSRMARVDPHREWQEVDRPFLAERLADVGAVADDRTLSARAAIAAIRRVSEIAKELMYRRFAKYMTSGNAAKRVIDRLARRLEPAARSAFEAALLGGLPLKTSEINAAIRALADLANARTSTREMLRSHPHGARLAALEREPEAADLRDALRGFLDRYGCRTAVGQTPMPSYPAWHAVPEDALATVAAMLDLPPRDETSVPADLLPELIRSAAPARNAEAKLAAAVAVYRSFWLAREDSLYFFEEMVERVRVLAKAIAGDLVRTGTLDDADDVLFLRLDELSEFVESPEADAATKLRRLAAKRRAAWEALRDDSARDARQASGGTLTGTGASGGVARGRVRVVRSAAEFDRLRVGEVLVCRATNPAWTPLFAIATAVVTETGGTLSHAAIVAREYGIPAVMSCLGATGDLPDGTLVSVDGTAGTVSILELPVLSPPAAEGAAHVP